MYQHLIHNHIEYGGGERISLRHSASSLKLRTVVSARPFHHRQPPPIRMEELKGSGAHAVTFQYIKAPGPVQGFIQEDHVQDLLP